MKKIGVEKGLSNVVDFLTHNGYSVEILSESIEDNLPKLDSLAAIVTSGHNTDIMGYSTTETKTPVVNAKGLSPEEVKKVLDGHI